MLLKVLQMLANKIDQIETNIYLLVYLNSFSQTLIQELNHK